MGRNSSRAEAYEQHVLETDLFLLVSSFSKLEPPWLYLIGENYGACCMLTLGQVKSGKASKVFRNILLKRMKNVYNCITVCVTQLSAEGR